MGQWVCFCTIQHVEVLYVYVVIPGGGGEIQFVRAITVILLHSPESHNPSWPTGVGLWTKMKCLRDTSERSFVSSVVGPQAISTFHWSMSIESSPLSLWLHTKCIAGPLFINYHLDGRLERHALCRTAYWHFYGHDFVLLPFKCIFLRMDCFFMKVLCQRAAKWWDPHNKGATTGLLFVIVRHKKVHSRTQVARLHFISS